MLCTTGQSSWKFVVSTKHKRKRRRENCSYIVVPVFVGWNRLLLVIALILRDPSFHHQRPFIPSFLLLWLGGPTPVTAIMTETRTRNHRQEEDDNNESNSNHKPRSSSSGNSRRNSGRQQPQQRHNRQFDTREFHHRNEQQQYRQQQQHYHHHHQQQQQQQQQQHQNQKQRLLNPFEIVRTLRQ
jgi:flagellar biosynthesis GTPase FlhF